MAHSVIKGKNVGITPYSGGLQVSPWPGPVCELTIVNVHEKELCHAWQRLHQSSPWIIHEPHQGLKVFDDF
jgi:hypothetical protein